MCRSTGISAACSMATAPMTDLSIKLVRPLPSLNVLQRTNKHVYKKARQDLAWEVVAELGRRRPAKPFERAELTVTRYSVGMLDEDNLQACRKALTDVLQPTSKRHPNGLGIILNDDPVHLKSTVLQVRVKHLAEQHTLVVIRDLGAVNLLAAQ